MQGLPPLLFLRPCCIPLVTMEVASVSSPLFKVSCEYEEGGVGNTSLFSSIYLLIRFTVYYDKQVQRRKEHSRVRSQSTTDIQEMQVV